MVEIILFTRLPGACRDPRVLLLAFCKIQNSKGAAGCSTPSNTACKDSHVDPPPGLRRDDDIERFLLYPPVG